MPVTYELKKYKYRLIVWITSRLLIAHRALNLNLLAEQFFGLESTASNRAVKHRIAMYNNKTIFDMQEYARVP